MLLFLTFAILVTFLLYGRALTAPFYLDDFIVLNNAESLYVGTRTLGYASFWLSHRIADWLGLVFAFEITIYYRLPNLLIHALAATAVFWLALELSGRRLTAGIAGALFLVHPIQTQAVTYVAQRFESQAALFMFISAAAFVHYRKSRNRIFLWLTMLAALAAALTKETAIALPVWLFAIEIIFFSGMPNLKRLLYWTPLLLTIVYPAYLAFLGSASTLVWIPFEYYLLSQCRVLLTYLKLLVWPAHQFLWYDVPPVTAVSPTVVFQWLLLIAIMALGIYLARKRPVVGFGILTFFLLLAPTSVLPLPDLIFEHRVYPAFAGIAIAVAAAFPPNRATAALFAVVISVLGVRTYVRNGEWNNRIAFFEAHRQEFPNDSKSLASLGTAYAMKGEIRKAIETNLQARRSLPLLNSYYYRSVSTVVDMNLALLYTQTGDLLKAREEALRVLAVDPNHVLGLTVLGEVQEQMGDLQQARKTFERVTALDTGDPGIWKKLQAVEMRLGDSVDALEAGSHVRQIHEKAVEQEERHRPSATYVRNVLFSAILLLMLLLVAMGSQIALHSKEICLWLRRSQV